MLVYQNLDWQTPPVLSNLTLSEKLLISVYRPKMYVTTLRPFAGPGSAQNALKGNTITFPQDIVKIAKRLPASTDILVDHLKVVFIGNGAPSREMLKKVFKVRREVYSALNFLILNHPLYTDVTLSNVNLPADDIPEEILSTMVLHKDPDNENGNEHANYTPQTDINSSITDTDTVVMESSGVIDFKGCSIQSSDKMASAVRSLQGTMYIPHGVIPAND